LSYLADTAVDAKPSGSYGNLGQLVYIAPDPSNPETFINVRLSNGSGYYTAGGTTVSGGATLTADQGAPGLLSAAWPVKLSNGSAMIGVEATPLWVTGTIGLATLAGSITVLSGSVFGLLVGGQPTTQTNPVPTQVYDLPTYQQRYDMGTGTIYIGYADRGIASSSPVWTIKRIYMNSSGDPFIAQWATTSSWDSRVGLTYS
jgi:hypothetical protein